MSRIVALLERVPLPAAAVPAVLLVHGLPELPGHWAGWLLLLAGIAGVFVRRGAARHAWGLAAVASLAAGWAIVSAERGLAERLTAELEQRDLPLIGTIDSMPIDGEHGQRFVFFVEECAEPLPGCPAARRLRLSWSSEFGQPDDQQAAAQASEPLLPGQRWRLTVRLKRPHAPHNPGTFDAELRALEEGIAAIGYVRSVRDPALRNQRLDGQRRSLRVVLESARMRLRDAMRQALAGVRPEAADVLVALVVGDQSAIAPRWWEIFNKTGVGHLMSISGLHITMLAGLFVMFMRRLLASAPLARSGVLLRWPARRLAWLAGVVVAFIYAGLAGWGIPAQRTCWMLAVAGWALFSGRSRSTLHVLALASAVVVAFDPWAPLAAGFWLSFASVSAIILYASARGVRGPLPAGWAHWRAGLVEAVRTQWAATLAMVPLGALFFSSVSLIGPLANALAIPLVSALITPLAMLGAALLPWLPSAAAVLLALPAWLTGWLLDLLQWLADLPLATFVIAAPDIPALLMAAAAVLLLLWPVPVPSKSLAFAGLLPLALRSAELPAPGEIRLTAIDVGQGMAVLVETPQRRLLYDTGPAFGSDSDAGARIIVPYLRARGIDRLDALIVSHGDADHAGGAASLLRSLAIDWVAGSLPSDHPARHGGRPFHDCRRGMSWRWGEVRFEFLHPGSEPQGRARPASNAYSCVLLIEAPAARLLLTGDIEARQERALVERFGTQLRADLMLAPHHGSNTSSTAAFIAAVAPAHAIAQAGYRNRFRHPTARVLMRYRDAGVPVLRSDRDGAITLHYAGGRALRLQRSRIDDRRYWRIRVDDVTGDP
ncbi:MAG: DNA internalization-related competence protein ComEC/Rec2 [Burkholderiales bacterium]|nr:DNA internalization-related competence protein ComEC/Rec2 [Burkholderiales bacterium]